MVVLERIHAAVVAVLERIHAAVAAVKDTIEIVLVDCPANPDRQTQPRVPVAQPTNRQSVLDVTSFLSAQGIVTLQPLT